MIAVGGLGRGLTGAIRYAMGEGNDPVTNERRPAAANDEASRVAWISGQGWEGGWKPETRQDVETARRSMENLAFMQQGRTKRCEKDCMHLVLAWRKGEHPEREEMERAAREALAAVGMEKARAIFIAHNDTDHAHLHIVASRINPETRLTFRDSYSHLKWQKWALKWEREHGQVQCQKRENRSQIQTAIEELNAAAVLDLMTKHRSTFTGRDLDRELAKYAEPENAAAFKAEILARPEVLALHDRESGRALNRFTTQEVREAEQNAIKDTEALAASHQHQITQEAAAAALAVRQSIREEQRNAFDHATGAEGLAIIDGKAGTGKSYTIGAIRHAYEADGQRVIGLAPTNTVAQDMERDGFKEAKTVHSALFALKNGRDQWNEKTVIIVDEAAMMDTKIMGELVRQASDARAKLILVGDDRQLASVERGGLFTELRERHGAAELSEVTRQKDADHRATAEMLARGEFGEAITALNKLGCITRSNHQDESREALVEQWKKDTAAEPDKSRFVFAYTNDDVRHLNAELRAVRKERGELGEDHELTTKDGKAQFAEGDRLIFTKTDRKQGLIVEDGVVSHKRQGITNGATGTIERIEGQYVTLRLDGKSDRHLTFDAGQFADFRHGYAGTIYKGQGRTFDEVYLYHSAHWRDASTYVALTRHRDDVKLFVSTEVTRDDADLARQMGRHDDRRASVAFATKEEVRQKQDERLTTAAFEVTRLRPAFLPDQQRDEAASALQAGHEAAPVKRAPEPQPEPTKPEQAKDSRQTAQTPTPPSQPPTEPQREQDRASSRVLQGLEWATQRFLRLFDPPKRKEEPNTLEQVKESVQPNRKAEKVAAPKETPTQTCTYTRPPFGKAASPDRTTSHQQPQVTERKEQPTPQYTSPKAPVHVTQHRTEERPQPQAAPAARPTAPIPIRQGQQQTTARQSTPSAAKGAAKGLRVGGKIAGSAAESLMSAVDKLLDAFLGSPPKPKFTMRDYAENPRLLEERKAAVERRGAALGRMGEDIKAEKNITPDDLRLLSREDLENIKAKGDAHLMHLIREREEAELRRSRGGGGRERER